jgi:hypothetical protein
MMYATRNIFLAVLAVTLLSIGVPLVAAQNNGIQYQESAGIVRLTTDDIDIKITGAGTTPHFQWWDPDSPTVDYHVMFVKLFEANDTNADGAFTLGTDTMIGAPFALPTSDWDISDFVVQYDGDNATAVHFNFTSTTTHDPRPTGQGADYGSLPSIPEFDVSVEIRVHIDLENAGEMKFDVVLAGWQWTYEDSILVMQFTVTESSHGAAQGTTAPTGFNETATQFNFANGYMQYESTALAAENTIQVKASHGAGTGLEAGESIYLAFEYFGNETLEYDPTIGILSTEPTAIDPILLLIGGAVALIVVVAVIVKLRK